MASHDTWRTIIASAFDWEQAHANLDASLEGLSAADRGKRPENYPHSCWELVEHIRRAQWDLLDFCKNSAYKEQKWPDDYWPNSPAPKDDAEWNASIDAIHRDGKEFAEFTKTFDGDLADKIPHGTGQTYLRTILVSIDHTSYHVGQILSVRRMIGAWKKP
jgi:hypothetical protein